jgi:hypothetical protein
MRDPYETKNDKIGKNGNINGRSDSDIPECVNGVTQECVISEIGLECLPGYDLDSPTIVGDGHACQDIYAGISEFK